MVINTIIRSFEIFVVGEDFLRADNSIMQVGTGITPMERTCVSPMVNSDLGFRRANNYVTLFLEVFDPKC